MTDNQKRQIDLLDKMIARQYEELEYIKTRIKELEDKRDLILEKSMKCYSGFNALKK